MSLPVPGSWICTIFISPRYPYRSRRLKFTGVLVIDDDSESLLIMLSLTNTSVIVVLWYEFKVSPRRGDAEEVWRDHAVGLS